MIGWRSTTVLAGLCCVLVYAFYLVHRHYCLGY